MRIYYLYNKKNPLDCRRDLIYFAPLMIITLFDANSSFFGVILSDLSPNLITIICLLLVLSITFYKSICKAFSTYTKELDFLSDNRNGYTLIMIDGIGEYFKLPNKCESQKIKIGREIKTIDFHIEEEEELPRFYVFDNKKQKLNQRNFTTSDDIEINEIIEIGIHNRRSILIQV